LNENNKKIAAIITSGGNSTRFGSNKLLEILNNKTVIETTVSKFVNLADITVIPCQNDIKETVLKSDIYDKNKIIFAHAGSSRQKSVYNGLIKLKEYHPDIVLIHDGARPYINRDIIQKTVDLTIQKKAVVVGQMAFDTIKTVKNGIITSTLDRNMIFQAQTPQSFNYDLIMNIHEKYKNSDGFTDDSSMAEAEGIEIYIIDNKNKNNKITFKDDLK